MHYWVAALKAGKISGLQFRMYNGGYKGVLIGDSFVVPESEWPAAEHLIDLGGSPIGNSRVKVCFMKVKSFGSFLFFWNCVAVAGPVEKWLGSNCLPFDSFFY